MRYDANYHKGADFRERISLILCGAALVSMLVRAIAGAFPFWLVLWPAITAMWVWMARKRRQDKADLERAFDSLLEARLQLDQLRGVSF